MSKQLLTTIDREGFGNDSHTDILIRSHTFNGDTNFYDDGKLGLTISNYGTPNHSTSTFPFGQSSIRFNGGSYIYSSYVAAIDYDSSMDFTFDFWIRFDNVAPIQVIAELFVGQSGPGWTMYNGGGTLYIYSLGTFVAIGSCFPLSNTWYHIAWVHKNGVGSKVFRDGKYVGVGGSPTPTGGAVENISIGGRDDPGPKYFMTGYMSDIRFSNCMRWWNNFNIPNRSYGR